MYPIIACAAQWCQPSHPEAEHGEVFGRNSFLSSTWRRESVNEWMEGEGRGGEERWGLEVPLIEQATVDISDSFVCCYNRC